MFRRGGSAVRCGTLLLVWMAAAPAVAEGSRGNDQWGPVVFGALAMLPSVLLIVAVLLPGFVRRVQQALRTELWPCLGWGTAMTVLVTLVAGILAQGGQAGRAAGSCVGVAGLLLALAGWGGLAKVVGDWALGRWGMTSLGPLSVLLGGILWAWVIAIPVVGWAGGLVMLIASLGATTRALLTPQAFAEAADVQGG